ncbi:MAG: LysE family translocator [Pseudomonadota bacterium]
MTTFDALIATLIGVLAAQAAPGPNLVAVAGAALGQGRSAALWVVLGIASGILVWILAVAAGLGAFLDAYPLSLVLLKFAGGLYLLYIGAKALLAARSGKGATITPAKNKRSAVDAWRHGLLVVLTNPKAALMWAAVATFLFGAGFTPWQLIAIGPIGSLTAILIYGTYGIVFSSRVAVAGYAKASWLIEGLFGTIFAALGGRLLYDGARQLRSL